MLSKEDILYDRDEKGNLIGQEVELEVDEKDEEQMKYKGEKIKVIPISRGKLKRIFSSLGEKGKEEKDFDGELILDHCADPKFTKEEIVNTKPVLTAIIVNTIFRESGIDVGKNSKKNAIAKAEDDFAKN